MDVMNTLRAGTGDGVAVLTLKKSMDMQETQMAQLLQTLPDAPQPAHLGSCVDCYA